MNFSQLKQSFETNINNTGEVDNAELAIWFNEAQNDLALDLGKITRKQYIEAERTVDGYFELPADFITLTEVYDSGGNPTNDYAITPDMLLDFPSGCPLVFYRGLPVSFTGIDDEQESSLPVSCQDLIVIYAMSRYWDRESEGDYEESNLGTKYRTYYEQGKRQRLRSVQQAGGGLSGRTWTVM